MDDSLWDHMDDEATRHEAAQSKRPVQDAPTQQPMRAGIKPAQQRKPSGDQKKVRRQMAKNAANATTLDNGHVIFGDGVVSCPRSDKHYRARQTSDGPVCPNCSKSLSTPTKESSTMTASPTESDLLSALAGAKTLAEQTEAANRLESFRAAKRESIAAEGSLWGNLDSPLPDSLYAQSAALSAEHAISTTAAVRLGHTEATDWMDDLTPTHTEDAVLSAQVRATATRWYENEVWAPVKADPAEFSSQAHNAARRTATAYGLQSTAAASVFLDQVTHLASREGITLHALEDSVPTYVSDGKDSLPVGVSPTDADAQKSMDEWGLDSDNNNSGDPKTTPGAGEAPSLSEGNSPETGSGESVENPVAGQDADASTFDSGNTEDKLLTQQSARRTAGETATCKHCGRSIEKDQFGWWVDKNATGDDAIWKETCDANDTFQAEHEPDTSSPGWRDRTGSKISASDPAWLSERNNDPYGTPPKHEFWNSVDWQDVNGFRVFQKDGRWFAHHQRQNYWLKDTDPEQAAKQNSSLDMWASKTAGEVPEAFKEQQKSKGDSGDSGSSEGGNTCSVCGDKIAKDPSGEDPSTWHHDNGETHDHEAKPSKTSKLAKVSLTNIGIVDRQGLIAKGKDSSGKEVRFKVSKSDMDALAGVLFSDLGVNFSGVDVDESDIITEANEQKSSSIFARMAEYFGGPTGGIQTHSEDTSAPDSTDGLGGIKEGDEPEHGHQEGFQHTPPRGNLDMGSPTDSDRPEGGVNWGDGGGAAKDQTGAYTSKASLSAIGTSFRGKRVSASTRTFAESLERVGSIDDEFGGVSARVIVGHLLNAPDVPSGIKGHLASHLSTEGGGAAPFVREAGTTCPGSGKKVQPSEITTMEGGRHRATCNECDQPVPINKDTKVLEEHQTSKEGAKTAEQFGRNTPDASTCDHEGGYEEKDGKRVCAECGLPWAIVEKRKGKESAKTASEWGDAHPGKERCPKTEKIKPGRLDQQRYVRCQGEKGHDGEHTFDESKTFPAPTASKTGGTVKVSEYPECDIHKYEKGQSGVPAKYDAPTTMGPWANMCEGCYATHGAGGDALKTTFVKEGSKQAAEGGATCANCGGAIERDPEGEKNRGWHHADGSKHEHEARPGGNQEDGSKESAKTATYYCTTHQVYVGDGNRDTHTRDSCNIEQRKKKDAESSLSPFARLVQAGLSRVADIFDDGMGGMPEPTHSWPCQQCGTTVEHYRGEGDVSCPKCNAQYNAFGQRLRDDWAGNPSNYDDEIGDLEGYEMQHAHDASRRTAGNIGDFRLNQNVMFNDRTPTGMGLAGETGVVEGINTADGTLTISVADDEGDHREVTVSPAIVETTGTSYTGSRRPFAREAEHSTDKTPGRWVVEVGGVGESVWSRNSLTFPDRGEAVAYAQDLSGRWFGMDIARARQIPEGGLPPTNTERIDPNDPEIILTYRTASLKTAGGTAQPEEGSVTDKQSGNGGQYKRAKCKNCGGGLRRRDEFSSGWTHASTNTKYCPDSKESSRTAAQSRNCLNGNHSDCTGSSCSCSCHKMSKQHYSGACADGDHGDCQMNHPGVKNPRDLGDRDCGCPDSSHKKTSSRTAEGQKYICPYCDFNGSHAEVGKHIEDAGPDHQANGSVTDQLNDKIRREKKGSKTAAPLGEHGDHPWTDDASRDAVEKAISSLSKGDSAAEVVAKIGEAFASSGGYRDSFDREHAFDLAAAKTGLDYNAIYDAWLDHAGDWGAATASRRTAMPSPAEAGIEVGDIYVSSWGYDQTNIDFYEVTRLMGASVAIRPIQKRYVDERGGPHDSVVAVPGAFTGGEMTKRVQSGSKWLNLNSYSSAQPWDGQPEYQTGYGYGH